MEEGKQKKSRKTDDEAEIGQRQFNSDSVLGSWASRKKNFSCWGLLRFLGLGLLFSRSRSVYHGIKSPTCPARPAASFQGCPGCPSTMDHELGGKARHRTEQI